MIVCGLYFGLVKKGHNSVKMLSMTFKFKDDLHFMMLYPSERNCCVLSKVIDQKPQFSQNQSKNRGHNSAKSLWRTSLFELDLY